jgi:hypothetical protein
VQFTEETGGKGQNWRAGEIQAVGVTVSLARAMPLAGVSRSVIAGGDQIHANTG